MESETGESVAGPTFLTVEAILEIDELRAGLRDDVPALSALFHALRTPSPSPPFEGNDSVSMLADVRSYSVLRNAIGENRTRKVRNFPEFQEAIVQFLAEVETGVQQRDPKRLDEAKAFCIALGNQLINRQSRDSYNRRERSDSRFISHEPLF